MRFFLFILSPLFLVACSSSPKNHKEVVYGRFIDSAFQNLESSESRTPANEKISWLNFSIQDLNFVKPGKFEVYVFPKIADITLKTSQTEEPVLGKPQRFVVSPLAISKCSAFTKDGLYSKLNAANAFSSIGIETKESCAIIELTNISLQALPRNLLKKGDQLKVRLFIDSNYKIYAFDTDEVDSKRGLITIRTLTTKDYIPNSELGIFPIDLPFQKSKELVLKREQLQATMNPMFDSISRAQIRKMNKKYTDFNCSGSEINFLNSLGSETKVAWCNSQPWPNYIETSKYISVTQPLEVIK